MDGLKQFVKARFNHFSESNKGTRYLKSQSDHTMFFKFQKFGKTTFLKVYVDYIDLTAYDMYEIDHLKKEPTMKFVMEDLDLLRYFSCMEATCSNASYINP